MYWFAQGHAYTHPSFYTIHNIIHVVQCGSHKPCFQVHISWEWLSDTESALIRLHCGVEVETGTSPHLCYHHQSVQDALSHGHNIHGAWAPGRQKTMEGIIAPHIIAYIINTYTVHVNSVKKTIYCSCT